MAKRTRVLSPLQRVFGEDFNFPLFLSIFRKSMVWIIAFVVIAMGAVFLYLRYTPKTYQSTALLIYQEPEAKQAIDFAPNQSEKAFSEIELIRSVEVVSRAMKMLPLEVSYYEKGNILTTELYRSAPFEVIYTIKDSSLLGHRVPVAIASNGSFTLEYGSLRGQTFSFDQPYETPVLDFVLKLTPAVASKPAKLGGRNIFFVINDHMTLVRQIQSQLSVSIANQKAGIISITLRDNIPSKAADIVNTLADVYVVFDRERQMKSADSSIAWLQRQIGVISDSLLNRENQLSALQKESGIMDPSTAQGLFFQQIQTLEKEGELLTEELESLDWISSYIEKGNRLSALSTDVVEGAYRGYMVYIASLQQLEKERDLLLLDVGPEHIKVKYLNDQISDERENLTANLENVRRQLQTKIDGVQREIREIRSQFQGLPEFEARFSQLSTLSDLKQKQYLQFTESLMEQEIIRAGIVTNFMVLDRARSGQLVAPRKRVIQFGGLLLALLVGFGLVVIRYMTQNKILSVQDVEDNSEIPLLGVIPRVRKKSDLARVIVFDNTRSTMSEAFRTVRTNMEFLASDSGHKTVAVTSTVSGEGKTFISTNIAAVISLAGKRVCMIDLDMRKPRVHRAFGLENLKGMSTILIGKNTIDDALIQTRYENLDVLPSGPIPPNSAELIISRKLKDVIDELKVRYEVVVIDTPPVGVVADALELLKNVDIPIYVFRSEYSNRDFINFPNKLFEEKRVPHLSIVLTDVKQTNLRYGKYGYTYAYGYGYNDESRKKKRFSLRRLRRKLKL